MLTLPTFKRGLLPLGILLLFFDFGAADAKEDVETEHDKPAPKDTGWGFRVRERVQYDSNVFRLSEDASDRLEEDRESDKQSGRFDDMESVDDFVLTTEVLLLRTFTDEDGDDFRIRPGFRYLTYLRNSEKNHPEFFVDFKQEYGSGRTLEIDVEYRQDVFARNYLADATDLVGSVSSDERRYEDGVYDESSAEISFTQRLWKRRKDSAQVWHSLGLKRLEAVGSLEVARRWYNVPFSNRDRDTLRAGVELSADIGKDWTVFSGYRWSWIRTDNGPEVLIRDEDDFDLDLNLDGDRVDQNIRTIQPVDRSRNEHRIEVGLSWEFAKDLTAIATGRFRTQDYLSDEELDDTHRDRVDRSDQYRLDVEWKLDKRWRLTAFIGTYVEDSNRDAVPDAEDEEVDYRRFYTGLSVRATF